MERVQAKALKPISGEDLKKIELDILLDIDRFCKENGLRYFLAYGTLIGAVRHKGFIPWDDDIDINMPRKDYDWLIENFNTLCAGSKYRLISPFSKRSKHSFVKIIDTQTVKIEPGLDYKGDYLGIDIDIFPLDGEPENDAAFEKWYDRLMKVYKWYGYCLMEPKGSLKRSIGVRLIRLVTGGRVRLLKKAAKLHSKYPYENAEYVGAVECAFNSKGNRFKKEWFGEILETDFEGHKLWIPAGYYEILSSVYGDYMKLPPVEKQVTHHVNKIFLKEDV